MSWRIDRIRRLGAAVLAAASVFFAPSVLARPLDDVIASGHITIFVYADYAPYSWERDGEMVGIDVEIAREIAEALDLELKLMVRQGDETVDDDLRVNVWRGDVVYRQAADVMLHVPFDRTLEVRSESLAILFNPYFGEQVGVAVDRAVLPEVETFARFVYNPIAVEVDTVSDFFLSNAFGGQLHQSIRRGRVFMDAVEIYRSGEAPALMATRAQAEWVAHITPGRDTMVVQPPTPGIIRSFWPIGMAVKHDSRDLGYALTDVITELVDSGRMEEICAEFGVTYVPPKLD